MSKKFSKGDFVIVVSGPDRDAVGHIVSVRVNSRGILMSRVALESELFGVTVVRDIANVYLRRA